MIRLLDSRDSYSTISSGMSRILPFDFDWLFGALHQYLAVANLLQPIVEAIE